MPASNGWFSSASSPNVPLASVARGALSGVLAVACSIVYAADVSWVGPANGQWANPSNWSGGTVPEASDNVTISGGVAVSIMDERVVEGAFTLAGDSLLLVSGTTAAFRANGVTALANGRVSVTGGAMAAFRNELTYEWTLCEQRQLFQAVGANSVLDLSGVTSIVVNAPACETLIQSVLVSDGGYIDFSGLQEVVVAESQQLTLNWLLGGAIETPNVEVLQGAFLLLGEDVAADFPSLATMTDSTIIANARAMFSANALTDISRSVLSIAGAETAQFDVLATLTDSVVSFHGMGTQTLPELTVIRDSTVTIGDGATLSMPKLTVLEGTDGFSVFSTVGDAEVSAPSLTAVRNMAFVASLGSVMRLPSVQSYHWDLCEGGALFTAGTESTIDFPELRTITIANSGCSGLGYPIGATGASQIKLPGLTTISAPVGQFVTFLASNAETVVDVSSLRTYNPAIVNFFESDSGRIIRAGSGGGEGEGEGEGSGGGCPAPAASRSVAASMFGDVALIAVALGVMGAARRRKPRM